MKIVDSECVRVFVSVFICHAKRKCQSYQLMCAPYLTGDDTSSYPVYNFNVNDGTNNTTAQIISVASRRVARNNRAARQRHNNIVYSQFCKFLL